MKVLITGGAGFIGSSMAGRLIAEGHGVTVLDNFSSGKPEYVSPACRLVKGDILDKAAVAEAMAGQEMVYHFAANPDIAKSMVETDLDLRLTVIATYNVLEAMRLAGVRRIAYSSGSGVYGDVGETPTPESFGPLLPVSMYGASKLGAEGIISAFCSMFDMQAWVFRFANVIGPRQTHGVIFDFAHKLRRDPKRLVILGDGKQSKSYIHVDDVLDAMLFVVKATSGRVNLYNVATDDYVTVTEIARIVIEELGLEHVELEYTGGRGGWKGDVPVVRFGLAKIHALGWRAKRTARDAVRLAAKAAAEQSRRV